MGRTGLAGPRFRPIQSGVRAAGTAVTVVCWPGDNLMIHVAVEQCAPGDILVVTTNSPSTDGLFGELFATALQARGVRGLVIDAGVRDVADLNKMGFPAWATSVSAQGTVKATAGSVNLPITLGAVTVRPGDVIVADDDAVVCVPRADVAATIAASRAREDKEEAARQAFRKGQLGLDRYGLRPLLDSLGVRYVSQKELQEEDTAR
jgi:4-hydroxy-4-methyl-2-oxoglutarate aldolase